MKLFSSTTYQERRNKLKASLSSGILLFMGNSEAPMNYSDNHYRFRQDSTFLYYFGLNLPDLCAAIDLETGNEWLFGTDFSIDDIIWMGPQPSLASLAEKVGVTNIASPNKIADFLKGKQVHFLPPYRHDNKQKLSEWLGISANELATRASVSFTKVVVNQRLHKSAEEIEEMEEAVNITRQMHIATMKAASASKMEYELVAELVHIAKKYNGELSYPAILTINGQTLHNHYHGHPLTSGRLVLNDSGAENVMGYAGDITRTFPVDKTFTTQQKEIYEIVLEMEETAIASLRPELAYRDVHIAANRLMLSQLKNIGIVSGSVDDMLAEGVGGLFMPHGLGHAIGLDVHDMEDLGEQYVGYTEGMQRSTQLGLKSLRMARALEEGFVLTVEPGIYFIPELIDKFRSENRFAGFVNYNLLEKYKNFGGIRIEDNVVITSTGHRVLGERIPKTIAEVEALRANSAS